MNIRIHKTKGCDGLRCQVFYKYLAFVGSGVPGADGPRFGFQTKEKYSTVNLVCSLVGEAVSSLPKMHTGVKLGYPEIVPSGKTAEFPMFPTVGASHLRTTPSQ